MTAGILASPGCSRSTAYTPHSQDRIRVILDGGQERLVKNGRRYDVGLFRGGVAPLVSDHPRARKLARRARWRTMLGRLLWYPGFTCVAVVGLRSRRGDTPEDRRMSNAESYAFLGCAAATFVGVWLDSSGHAAMWDAINIYNDADLKNTVTPPAPRKGGAVGPMMPR